MPNIEDMLKGEVSEEARLLVRRLRVIADESLEGDGADALFILREAICATCPDDEFDRIIHAVDLETQSVPEFKEAVDDWLDEREML